MTFNLAVVLRESRNAHPDKPLCHIADQISATAEVDKTWAGSPRAYATSVCTAVTGRGPAAQPAAFFASLFGILKAGAVMVPLNPLMRTPGNQYHLRDSESRC